MGICTAFFMITFAGSFAGKCNISVSFMSIISLQEDKYR